MLTTCFGCCPLRHGVSFFAIFNLLLNIFELIKHGFHRYYSYNKMVSHEVNHVNSTTMRDTNSTESEDSIMFEELEVVPAMNGIFMDYLFFVCYGWIVLELIVNIGLKRATFKHATHYIYAWLIVYYGNLIFMITHLVYYAVKHIIFWGSVEGFLHVHIYYVDGKHLFMNSFYIILIAIEIIIIHSYYIAEEKSKLQKFVQIKWKYVSRGEVVSRGVNYPSAANFNELTSRGTKEGSTIPPYITNVLQD